MEVSQLSPLCVLEDVCGGVERLWLAATHMWPMVLRPLVREVPLHTTAFVSLEVKCTLFLILGIVKRKQSAWET